MQIEKNQFVGFFIADIAELAWDVGRVVSMISMVVGLIASAVFVVVGVCTLVIGVVLSLEGHPLVPIKVDISPIGMSWLILSFGAIAAKWIWSKLMGN